MITVSYYIMSDAIKCSNKHLQEYRKTINRYLLSKDIKDFSKYEVSIKHDNIFYNRWEYPGLPRLEQFNTATTPEKYVELRTRAMIIDIKATWDHIISKTLLHDMTRVLRQPLYFNAFGDLVDETYTDSYYIQYVESVHVQKPNTLLWEWIEARETIAINGLIRIGNVSVVKDRENTTGLVRLIYFYSIRHH